LKVIGVVAGDEPHDAESLDAAFRLAGDAGADHHAFFPWANIETNMTVRRLDNVAIVFEDLESAVAFFRELGLEVEGRMRVEGEWAGRVVGLGNIQSDIVMMRTPDGHGRLELSQYLKPAAVHSEPRIPASNTAGMHRVMFAVDDIDDTIARLRPHGAELIGEVVQYEDTYRLCYLRGPEGIILALAEELKLK
jgi:catechol 2,3-dioxygenase-like lactoylglutathione lyase family enzyme